ncbi:hypothetical protein, partial [Stenotrophomonas maltophilia]
IAVGNVFTNAGSALTGTGLAASNGAIAINLQQADRLGNIDGGTVQVSVRTGDLAIGNIDAAGAIALQGPTGTLRL